MVPESLPSQFVSCSLIGCSEKPTNQKTCYKMRLCGVTSPLTSMMATAEANGAATLGENTSEMAELTGSAVLVVIGEPFTGDHKELVLERITKG